jgi:hypothetical protein
MLTLPSSSEQISGRDPAKVIEVPSGPGSKRRTSSRPIPSSRSRFSEWVLTRIWRPLFRCILANIWGTKRTTSGWSIGDGAEVLVDVDLLQVGLGQPFVIGEVLIIGPLEQDRSAIRHTLSVDDRSLAVVLGEVQFISPGRRRIFVADLDLDVDIRDPPGGQATETRDPATFADGLRESSPHRDDVVEKTEDVKKIRFSRSIRTDDEDAALKLGIRLCEVAPVPQRDARESHGVRLRGLHLGSSARTSNAVRSSLTQVTQYSGSRWKGRPT